MGTTWPEIEAVADWFASGGGTSGGSIGGEYLAAVTAASSDNHAAIETAIAAAHAAGGGIVSYPAGTFITSGGHTVYANVIHRGAGKKATTIKLKNSSNQDLFTSESFVSLTGLRTQSGPGGWAFEFLTLDGNGANQASTSFPLRVYGSNYRLESMDIINGYSGCFWTEWGNGGADMESTVIDCKFHDNLAGDTVTNYGPHDAKWAHVMIYHCGSVTPGRGYVVGKNGVTSGNGAGGSIHTDMHCFGYGTVGVDVDTAGSVQFSNCMSEGFTTNLRINQAGVIWNGGQIFGTGASGETGIALTQFAAYYVLDGLRIWNFGAGSTIVNFGVGSTEGGLGLLRAQVRLGAATLTAGQYVKTTDVVELTVTDALSSSIYNHPTAPSTTFTSSGTYTIPLGAKSLDIYAISGGCGGGSGSTAASGVATFGGGGGSGGQAVLHHVDLTTVTDTQLTITVGTGGAGGTAVSASSTPGVNGTNGTLSRAQGATSSTVFAFATQANADNNQTVAGGRGGSTASGAGGTVQNSSPWSAASGTGSSSISAAAGTAGKGTSPGAGAGGGGVSATPAFFAGGGAYYPYGRNDLYPATQKLAGATSTGASGIAGTTVNPTLVTFPDCFGVGGSGGASSITVGGGAGGAGGLYGGGGGGGGACLNGSTSGVGGAGGDGIVVIVAHW